MLSPHVLIPTETIERGYLRPAATLLRNVHATPCTPWIVDCRARCCRMAEQREPSGGSITSPASVVCAAVACDPSGLERGREPDAARPRAAGRSYRRRRVDCRSHA